MKYLILCAILMLGAGLTLQAYAFQDSIKPADVDWETIDAVEAIAIANEWKWSQKDVKSSVTAREVVFEFADGTKQMIPLPEERMLVAVAPYLRKTHKWTTHFMSSCQGELPEKAFYVTAVDQNGELLVNQSVTTLQNGFFELWLPRKRIIDLRIQGFNRVAQGKITTFDASKTCVTTFRLQ